MRHRRLVLLLLLPLAPIAAQSAPIDRAAWLAGCWEQRTPTRLTVEMWMPPAGGMMLGASRTTMGDQLRAYELLRLTATGDTLVYTASPSGQATTSFRSVLPIAPDELVVENLAHDFPQRISYRRVGADSLVARVEGPGQDGGMRGFGLAMRRVSCTI